MRRVCTLFHRASRPLLVCLLALAAVAALPSVSWSQSFTSNVREVEITLDLSRSCLQETCGPTGDCNADCARVSPMFAKVFWASPAASGEVGDSSRAREVQWTVRCYTQPIGRSCEDSPYEECITRSPCLEEGDVVRIVASSDPEAKQVLMNQLYPTMAAQHGYGATPDVARPSLFGRQSWEIEAPHNAIRSGLPVSPDFSGDGLLEWFYDVELVRDGEVVLRLDPEIWIEEEGGG